MEIEGIETKTQKRYLSRAMSNRRLFLVTTAARSSDGNIAAKCSRDEPKAMRFDSMYGSRCNTMSRCGEDCEQRPR
jgi:hypothetical protein